MPCIAYIDALCMRHKFEKFLDVRFLHELGRSAAYQEHRNPNPSRRFLQCHLKPTTPGRARTIKKAWIPMPTPAAVG